MHKHHNGLKTAALFGGILALLLGLGAVVGRRPLSSGSSRCSASRMTVYGYWNSDKLAIRAMHAYPVSEAAGAGDVPHRARALDRGRPADAAPLHLARPRRPTPSPPGATRSNAAVCCTEGILSLLDERELRGVLGHELMHVYNRDILTGSVAAAVAGVITSIGQMLMFASMFGGGGSDEDRRNPIAAAGACRLLAPFAAMIIQLAISRTREYDADEDGATLTGDPLALASALRKLETGVARAPLAPPAARSSTPAT